MTISYALVLLGALFCIIVLRIIAQAKRIPEGLRLPPGPPGNLFLGNALDMPIQHGWEVFTRWAKVYGDIIYLNVLGIQIIVVNSADLVSELLDKRSKIYSDRPDLPMLSDLMGFDWDFGVMHYGEWWRRHRKMFHQEFQPSSISKYTEIQTRQTRSILRKFHETPHNFAEHLRYLSGAIIMEVTYGFNVRPGDRYLEVAEKAMEAMAEAGVPGAFLVDILPILKYVPEWMIGAGFKKKARQIRVVATEVAEAPFSAVRREFQNGTAQPSVLVSLLEKLEAQSNIPIDEETVIQNVTAVAYIAGADSTVSAMNAFILAMVLFPEAQRKAQEELDSVLGTDRLPDFSNRPNLPYVNALCQEVLRWRPVTPLGVPHRVTQDDVYGNHFIPKGSIVIGNTWAILHNEKDFGPEPDKFRPERFLDPKVKYPAIAFGAGRRYVLTVT
ncbi:cytochrome P450 [Ramaria rubella]|nr:cytochrome P450 [Ramaria rubella]